MTEKEISDSLFFILPLPLSLRPAVKSNHPYCKFGSPTCRYCFDPLMDADCCGNESTCTYSNELDREYLAPRDSLHMCFWSVKLIAVYLAKVNFSLGRKKTKTTKNTLRLCHLLELCSSNVQGREGLNYKPNWVCELQSGNRPKEPESGMHTCISYKQFLWL